MTDRVWSIKLADEEDHHSVNGSGAGGGSDEAPLNVNSINNKANSDRILRMSVWPSSSPPLTVSEVCRKAIESSPEWMVKITHRALAKFKAKKDRPSAVKVQYGAGYETIVLLDDAILPENVDTMTHPIAIESVVAPVVTEESLEATLTRRQKYGINSFGDEMQDHCSYVQSNEVSKDGRGVRIYLYPTSNKQLPRIGSWDEEGFNRKHVFRMQMNPKNRFEVLAVEQCHDLEKELGVRDAQRKQQKQQQRRVSAASATTVYEKIGQTEDPKTPAPKKVTPSGTTNKKTTATARSRKKETTPPKKSVTKKTTTTTTAKKAKTTNDKDDEKESATKKAPPKATDTDDNDKPKESTPKKKRAAPKKKKTDTTAESKETAKTAVAAKEGEQTTKTETPVAKAKSTTKPKRKKDDNEGQESATKKRKKSSTESKKSISKKSDKTEDDKPKKRSKMIEVEKEESE